MWAAKQRAHEVIVFVKRLSRQAEMKLEAMMNRATLAREGCLFRMHSMPPRALLLGNEAAPVQPFATCAILQLLSAVF